ncbi:hypothetical protein [Sphingomonas sp. BK580]|uniref:hypothetical protein n=1 Tax=Sphingomonas sp. BK580 TaxID=2586972 RepID=UPI00160B0803|nr:hypothetical protein [Sphingomonas sp. BK580]MBB3692328.1 hypothetical protein [Sphingomonas sp. BK580]
MIRSRLTLALTLLLIGCGCGRVDENESANAPAINVTAAPGVAFTYAYLYTLPPAAIARVQEEHARACERLGVARCRITGMSFTVRSVDRVDATLALRLDPALARAFGRESTLAAERADGMLSRADISGTDVGSDIAAAERERAAISDERARLDRERLATHDASTRAALLRQRATLDSQRRAGVALQRDHVERLAATPLTITYRSGEAIRSLRLQSPVVRAADTALRSLEATFTAALQLAALLLGPALLALIVWLAWRWRLRGWWGRLQRTSRADHEQRV